MSKNVSLEIQSKRIREEVKRSEDFAGVCATYHFAVGAGAPSKRESFSAKAPIRNLSETMTFHQVRSYCQRHVPGHAFAMIGFGGLVHADAFAPPSFIAISATSKNIPSGLKAGLRASRIMGNPVQRELQSVLIHFLKHEIIYCLVIDLVPPSARKYLSYSSRECGTR